MPPEQTPEEIAKELADLKAASAKEKEELELLRKEKAERDKKPDPTKPNPDDDLADKARKERERLEKENGNSKSLESAIRFTMGAKDWLKTNAAILPKTIPSILEAADKENYATAIEKDGAIKVGIISEFFAIQSNVDMLTAAQKQKLEDFLKLTKNSKQEKAQAVYDDIFEPTFDMIKRVRKAEQVRQGHADPTDAEEAHKQKLIKSSRKHYLGEKSNA